MKSMHVFSSKPVAADSVWCAIKVASNWSLFVQLQLGMSKHQFWSLVKFFKTPANCLLAIISQDCADLSTHIWTPACPPECSYAVVLLQKSLGEKNLNKDDNGLYCQRLFSGQKTSVYPRLCCLWNVSALCIPIVHKSLLKRCKKRDIVRIPSDNLSCCARRMNF